MLLLFFFSICLFHCFVVVPIILVFVVLMLIFVFVDFSVFLLFLVSFLCCYVVKLGKAKKQNK